MFIQIVQGTVTDPESLQRSIARWRTEIKPGAQDYLGSTGGVTSDGRAITIVRFESEEAALANSDRPEQSAWWAEASKAFGSDVTFHNCTEVDTSLGGGNDAAGFVQVIQARAKDQAAMRRLGTESEGELHAMRPDILGVVVAWHGEGGFTQAVYFASQEAARVGEKAMEGSALLESFMALIDGEMTFFDLADPDFD
jgi:hypothetical protein